jgi:hypothetical protein
VVLPLVQSYGLPTEYNFFVTVFLFAFIAGVLYQSAGHLIASGVHRKNAKVGTIARRKTTNSDITFNKNNNDSTFVISEIQNRSYLKHICFFDLMATVIRVLIDNATLSQLALHDEEQVKSSLTLISGVQSFFMIPMQLASGPFFTYFGVMYGISLLPLTVFCFSLSTYLTKVSFLSIIVNIWCIS